MSLGRIIVKSGEVRHRVVLEVLFPLPEWVEEQDIVLKNIFSRVICASLSGLGSMSLVQGVHGKQLENLCTPSLHSGVVVPPS